MRAAQAAARSSYRRLAALLCAIAIRVDTGPAAFHAALDLLIGAGLMAAAEDACRARLRQRAADPAALVRLAFLLLDSGRAAEAADLYREIDRRDGVSAASTEVFIRQRLDLAKIKAGEPYYRWLEDVRIDTAYWTIMKDGGIYNDDVHAKNLATSPFIRGRVSADGHMVVAALPAPQAVIADECILVGGDDNYSHWLFRNLLKLSTLDRAGLLYSLPWLVNSDLRPYQIEYMRLLGQDPANTIRVAREGVIRCARVLVPALHVNKKAISAGVDWIRERLAPLQAAPATRLLFVSRRDNGRRRVVNEDELFDAVAPLGFERVVPGNMTVAAQIAAFASARVIVAAHGAGLTNMIFTPPGAVIVELTSTAIEHMDLFRMLSQCTGHTVETLRSADYAVPEAAINVNSDYRVDAAAVRRAAEAALQRTA